MAPTQGNKVSGTVTFVPSGDKLKVFAEVSGLTPGLHGFHIHEKGDCSAPDGTSAGGHFNPTSKPHGNPERAFNLRRHTVMPKGGHFAALEEPELLVDDIRAFFRPLRFGAAND